MHTSKFRITTLLKLLIEQRGFTPQETKCETLKNFSEDALVIKIHSKLKELIEKHCIELIKGESLSLKESDREDYCLVMIKPKSLGDVYWDMVFNLIIKGLSREKAFFVLENKKLIKDKLEKVLSNSDRCQQCTNSIVIKNGIFRASIFIDGSMIRFENTDAEVVAELIESKLPTLIEVLIPEK